MHKICNARKIEYTETGIAKIKNKVHRSTNTTLNYKISKTGATNAGIRANPLKIANYTYQLIQGEMLP